ncbi:hypothetical protein [Winogradskyella sp.]|uniref:hypothetical protein n=1 Tax=Winogradskyella sp. TaxID=1883156 RepID=UPI00263A04A4|nr:hypothetical protein [Winogradskyella sp.]
MTLFLKEGFSNFLIGENCIIDGEAVLPELVIELVEKYPNDIKICFLGYTKIGLIEKVKQVKEYAQSNRDWISDKSDEYITDHIQNMLPHSKHIKKSCESTGIEYFDTSTDFKKTLLEVKKYMTS